DHKTETIIREETKKQTNEEKKVIANQSKDDDNLRSQQDSSSSTQSQPSTRNVTRLRSKRNRLGLVERVSANVISDDSENQSKSQVNPISSSNEMLSEREAAVLDKLSNARMGGNALSERE